MPDFAYKAREATGSLVTGVITASNHQDALNALATQQLFPVKVDLSESSKEQQKQITRRVSQKQLAIFYGQLADLLKSGVPLLRSLELLERQTSNAALKSVMRIVRENVSDGTSLADAMRHHPKAFNELVVSMVRAGEEGGFLEDVLKRVAAFTDHQEEIKARVIGAMVYPILLLGFSIVLVTVMLVAIVPKFQPIFDRMSASGSLPWATTTLLAISDFVQNYWFIVVAVVVAAIYWFRGWITTEEGRYKFDELQIKAPAWGRVTKSLSIARFCRMLGTLLHNGVPILQSLNIAKDATGNRVLSAAVANASENLTAGKSLADPLSKSEEFPEEIVEMIAVGEESNNLEEVLINVAENLERRTNRELDMAVRLLEPLMLLLMAVLVLFIAVALLLPILNSSSTM